MEQDLLYDNLFRGLHANKVRYLVAGGVAMVLHGHVRFTFDLDVIVNLVPNNVLKFLKTMKQIGYVPRLPVPAEDFAVSSVRESWIRNKHMRVFTFYDPASPWTGPVDVFVREPLPFGDMYRRREPVHVRDITVSIVSKEDLLLLKKKANRDKDQEDIKELKKMINSRKK